MSETDTAVSSSRWGELIDMQSQQMVQIVLLGVGVGLVTWLLTMIVRQVIIVPIFCGDPTNGICVSGTGLAGGLATVIAGVIGVLGLVRLSIFRPLLIAVAAAIVMWGMSDWVVGMPWYEALAWALLLYALAYLLFAWLVRPRAFLPAIIIVVVVVILARVLPAL